MKEEMIDENGYIVEPEELEQEYESSYYVVITSQVMTDPELSDFQKLLYGTISGLCRARGYCWASNAYLEKILNKKTTQVSLGIKKLVERGYINNEIVYKRKVDEDGNIEKTKQISYRKLMLCIPGSLQNQKGGILENQKGGILENQNHIINNNYNNNLTSNLLHKSEGEQESSPKVEDDLLENNMYYIKEENDGNCEVLEEETKSSKTAPAAAVKKKGGLAPLIDEIERRFPKTKYLELNNLLNAYIHAYIGCRKLPDIEKWYLMLNDLETYSSIRLAGTSGLKLNVNIACEIVTKALNGKDGAPFTEFDDIYHYSEKSVMEPHFNLNQTFNKGY